MKDPAALLYIDKWIVATTEMNAITRAYYMDLIIHQFDKGSLPNDIEELANICRVRYSEFEQFEQVFKQVLKQKFELNENGRLENSFAREIIQKRKLYLDKRSNSGKISYMVRYLKRHFKANSKLIEWLKSNIDFDNIDLKNEQVFKHMLEQKIELYINENENEDKNINKVKDYKKIYSQLKKELNIEDEYDSLFIQWFSYKSEKNQSYKIIGMRSFLNKWSKKSTIELEKAIKNSISNNYDGLFESKKNVKNTIPESSFD